MTENEEEVQNVEAGSEDEVLVRIEIPDELKMGAYANHVAISTARHEFVITFAQIMPLRDNKAIQDALETRTLEAVAVANIAIPHGLLAGVIKAFQTNLDGLPEKGESD